MLLFLIDENLPRAVGEVFTGLGFRAECVGDNPSLRQKSDEVIFEYAVERKAVIVTRDVGFANPFRFPLNTSAGLIVLRFPNEISMNALCAELRRLIEGFGSEDFNDLIVVEPGSVRKRKL